MQTIKYRPEIDGLRFLAIFSVIFYHFQINWNNQLIAGGGFLGVDIFFVISGYLITSMIISSTSDKSFSARSFYNKRIRRIVPVILLMLLSSIWIAWHYFLSEEMRSFSFSGISTLGFIANIWFFSEDSYIAAASGLKPLLHMWSLGVEEQFYIFFPALLILTIRLNLRLVYVLATIFIISIFSSEYLSRNYQEFNFYLLPSRCWELFIGAFCAIFAMGEKSNFHLSKVSKNIVTLLSLFVIVFSFHIFDKNSRLPSLLSLIPVLSTALIISFTDKKTLVYYFLSFRPIRYLGKISYGLYVWHWPVLVYLNLSGVKINPFIPIGFTIFISILSFHFFEKIFRYKLSNARFYLITGALYLLLVIFFIAGIYTGYSHRMPNFIQEIDALPNWHTTADDIGACHGRTAKNPCTFKFREKGMNVILIGDSHASALTNQIKIVLSKDEEIASFQAVTWGGCLVSTGLKQEKPEPLSCELWNKILQNFIDKLESNTIIIIAQRYAAGIEGTGFTDEHGVFEGGTMNKFTVSKSEIIENILLTYQRMIDSGHKVIIVGPVPEIADNVRRTALYYYNKFGLGYVNDWIENSPVTTSYKHFLKRQNRSMNMINTFIDKNSSSRVGFVEPAKILCDHETCYSMKGNDLLYWDSNHIGELGASFISNELLKEIDRLKIAQ